MGTQLISASPEDFDLEAESMTSQSSLTARTRLTEKFDIVWIFSKTEFTLVQINKMIAEHVKVEMAKGGEHEDLRAKTTDIGGFKQANVCIIICFCMRMFGSHNFEISFPGLPSLQ